MFPDLIDTPSSNWNERPAGPDAMLTIDTVIIHYTGMPTVEHAIARLCDSKAAVSAHYLIAEDGNIHQLVAPEKRAWHAGVSRWCGRDNLNHTSIGIELVNPGHEFGYRAFPDAQIDCLLRLLGHLQATFNIPAYGFVGHSDIAPDRKQDPGELFPWQQLAGMGFGFYPRGYTADTKPVAALGDRSPEIALLKENLSLIGYDVDTGDGFTKMTQYVLTAFQRHWRQSHVSGILDAGTQAAVIEVASLAVQYSDTGSKKQ